MPKRIVVVNPNSTEAVTSGIDEALEPLRMRGGPVIECVTLKEGPPGIESQADADSVIQPLCQYMRIREREADAFVIACYSDPGLHATREAVSQPVLGIAECGMLTALTRGERFGVISILESSIPRHRRYIRALGLDSRFAADLAVGLGIAGLVTEDDEVIQRMTSVGLRLRDEHGADVIIMGCAGMARFRFPLEDGLATPVVDPTQAAVVMAIGAVSL